MSFIASQALARQQQASNGAGDDSDADGTADAMAALERQARAPQGFVAASTGPEGGNVKDNGGAQAAASETPMNPDAIELDI